MKKTKFVRGGPGDATFIRTFSGRFFWPLDPRADEVFIEDIAHSLANSCRWTGHVREFYSVAQHSVLASIYVPREHALQALLHDASEAYLVDLSRPIKHAPGLGEIYKKVERKLEEVIFERFGLPTEIHVEVRKIDDALLWTEKRDLMAGEWNEKLAGEKKLLPAIVPWTPIEAERRFLARFAELTRDNSVEMKTAIERGPTPATIAAASISTAHAPVRPPNSFTQSEYMRDNNVAKTTALNAIRRLHESGKIRSIKIPMTRSDGQRITVSGWQLVPDAAD